MPLQEEPRKRRIEVTRNVDGHPVEEWIEVVDEGGPEWGPRESMRVLNADVRRVDGPEKAAGSAVYPHDVRLPGMVWARVLAAPFPRAKVELDLGPALALDGVVDATSVLEGDTTLYLGQPVAAVVAETPERAEDGLRAIVAEWEEGLWVVDRESALAEGAPAVSARAESNATRVSETGDEAAARAAVEAAPVRASGTFTTPVQHHACLETHGVVVDYRGGDEATIHASTQGCHGIADDAAEVLGLPASRVRTLVPYMGGGFGSKFGLDVMGRIACLLAKRVERPVHLFFTRRDEFLAAGNRSGSHQRVLAGASKDGRLVGLLAEVDRLGGVGLGSHPGLPYVYEPESLASFCRMRSVLTNTDSNRAMRAPGHPQASFAMESIVDELAYAAGIDLLEIRERNLDEPYPRQLGLCAREIGWDEHPFRTEPGPGEIAPGPGGSLVVEGIGFGVSTWGGGGRPVCEVDLRIGLDGSVAVSVGSQDLGTGTRTYLASIVAEELALPVARIDARLGDSRFGNANGSGGSVTTASLAPAVKDAAHQARLRLLAHVAELFGSDAARLSFDRSRGPGAIVDADDPGRSMSWSEACSTLPRPGIATRGEWRPGLSDAGVHGAQAARVEVDLETGHVRVLKMVCVQDCGLPLNRLAIRSQIHGGMIQALGFALHEERVLDPWLGVQLNADLEGYRIPGCLEIPELVAIIDEEDVGRGVIGIGEPPVIPGASAIANAVRNACGVRVHSLPITPDKLLAALVA